MITRSLTIRAGTSNQKRPRAVRLFSATTSRKPPLNLSFTFWWPLTGGSTVAHYQSNFTLLSFKLVVNMAILH